MEFISLKQAAAFLNECDGCLIYTHANPDGDTLGSSVALALICFSSCLFTLASCKEEEERVAIIRTTYENALANGDKNVYFIEGKTLMQYAKNEGTVDGCHPTDFGFYSMAKTIASLLETILL